MISFGGPFGSGDEIGLPSFSTWNLTPYAINRPQPERLGRRGTDIRLRHSESHLAKPRHLVFPRLGGNSTRDRQQSERRHPRVPDHRSCHYLILRLATAAERKPEPGNRV